MMMIRRQFVLFALLSLAVGASCLLAADDKKGDEKKLPKVLSRHHRRRQKAGADCG